MVPNKFFVNTMHIGTFKTDERDVKLAEQLINSNPEYRGT